MGSPRNMEMTNPSAFTECCWLVVLIMYIIIVYRQMWHVNQYIKTQIARDEYLMHRRLSVGDERRRTATPTPSSHETPRQHLNRDLQQVYHEEILNERTGWIIDGKTNDILEDDTVDTVEGIKLEASQRAHGNITYSTRSCRNMEELYDSDDFTDSISNLGAIKRVSSVSSGSRYTAHLLQRRSRAGSSSGSLSSSPSAIPHGTQWCA